MLIPVDARYLRSEWDYVRAGLEKIIDKTSDDWIPEDVYHEIKAGTTGLFLLEYGGERIGFVCLQIWPAYHAGPRLFIRAFWADPHAAVKHRADIYDDLKAFAREAGCVGPGAMRQNSPRRWDADGWRLKQHIYEMDVEAL